MNLTLTDEQQHIVDKVIAVDSNQEPANPLIAVDACAGSGKTALLQEITNELDPQNGLYLCYNKAIAEESKNKFKAEYKIINGRKTFIKGTMCSTSHSMAYQNTITLYKLKLGSFFWKTITERVQYEEKLIIVDLMKEWCMSEFDMFDKFSDYKMKTSLQANPKYYAIVKKYFNKMIKGEIPISHDGYLKFYHMLLAHKKIVHKEFDILLGDEVGDLAAVTFEIMKLIPAKRKVFVGDRAQNIYRFNHTINCFEKIEKDLVLSMSQSFRCSTDIAKRIDGFSKSYINPNKNFIGIKYDDMSIKTSAYISRNNAQLIERIIQFSAVNTKYNLFRPADSIFELILILLSSNNKDKRIERGDFRYLQEDIDKWNHSLELQDKHRKPFSYLNSLYGEETGFKTAFTLIREYGPATIYKAYESAKQYEKDKTVYPISVGTVFGTKGLEFDKVTILSDLNAAVADVLEPDEDGNKKDLIDFTEDEQTVIYLYYVACSRAKKELVNATHLPKIFNEFI